MTTLTPHLEHGRLRFWAGEVCIENATCALVVERDGRRLTWQAEALVAAGNGWTALWAETGLRFDLTAQERDGGIVLSGRLEHSGDVPLRLQSAAPLAVVGPAGVRVGADAARWSVYRNGYQSWSGTRAYGVGEADADPWWAFLRDVHIDPMHRASGSAGSFRSDLVTAIVDRASGAALAIGFLDTARFIVAVEVDAAGGEFARLTALVDGDGVTLRPGQRLALPALWLGAGSDGCSLLEQWASACGAAMQARVPAQTPIGWCSWYYYFTRISEVHVLDAVDALSRLRPRIPCEYVQVDDGYQSAIGDWLQPNAKFPHGMRWLAQRIEAAGFAAGIWVAPFLARPESRLFQSRPEWFLRTPTGALRWGCWNPAWGVGRPAYVLDTTRDDVLAWLRDLARTLVHQWGYRFLKLDFLYAAALPGVRADPAATRAEALRRGLEAIRDGAGPDAFLLACGCPLGPAVGIVDGMRIGADVAPFWENAVSRGPNRGRHGVATRHALRNTLTRAFMHRRLWLNDPDCLMVRAADTRLRPEEVQSLATVIALTDGMFILGDRLETLPPERLAWVERMLPLLGGAARVDDLFERDMPELLRARYDDGEAVAVFNFTARRADRRVTVDADASTIEELWSGAMLPVLGGAVLLPGVPAHGCRLLWVARPGSVAGAATPA